MRFSVALACISLCGCLTVAHASTGDSTIQAAIPIDRPAPAYPPNAANAEGVVTLGFTIGIDGRVKKLSVIKSELPPAFDAAAIAAVTQWRYQPRLLGGRPVEQADNTIQLHFKPVAPDTNLPFIYRSRPSYPREAFLAKQEGHVTVRFDITDLGLITNVRIEDSVPPGVFDKEALAATRFWRFAPAVIDGSVQRISNAVVTIPFTLANADVEPIPAFRPKPVYPKEAIDKGIIGYCHLTVHVADDGTAVSPKIVDTYPPDIFRSACLDHVSQWTWQPPSQDPIQRIRRDVEAWMNFCLKGLRFNDELKPGEWVKIEYTETDDGHVKDAKIVGTSAPGVATKGALAQVSGRQLAPIMENGAAVTKPGKIAVIIAPDHPGC